MMRKALAGIVLVVTLLAAGPWLTRSLHAFKTALVPADARQAAQEGTLLLAEGGHSDAMQVVLYFRYLQTGYLAQEVRTIEVTRNEPVEWAIVRAVMEGPDASSLELTSPFSANAQPLRVSREQEGLVTVVLDQQFLSRPQDAPDDWEQYEYWQQEVPRRRRLALQAITNALTEGARCDGVEFFISSGPGDTQGTRMARRLFNPQEQDAAALLPTQRRSEESILTPRAALSVALDAWYQKDWMTLYSFLYQNDHSGQGEQDERTEAQPPSQAEFLSGIDALDRSLLNYKLSTGTLGVDGEVATLCLDAHVMRKGGQIAQIIQQPVAMVRERGCWKLPYDTLLKLMQA